MNRILVAAALLGVFFSGFFYEPLFALPALLVALMGVITVWEISEMFRPRGVAISKVLTVGTVVALAGLGWNRGLADSYLIVGLAVVVAFAWRMARGPIEGAWRDVSATAATALYIGIPVAVLVELFVRNPETRAFLVFMLGIAWATDTSAMIAGKRFGRVKLCPSLSPGKTWEGALGAVIGSMIPAVIVRAFFPDAFWMVSDLHLLLLCIIFSVIAQVGDLAESLVKRAAGVKDSGRLLGEHGGVFDRVDSILFMAVPYAIYMRLFQPDWFLK